LGKTLIFFTKNWQKLQKSVNITSTPRFENKNFFLSTYFPTSSERRLRSKIFGEKKMEIEFRTKCPAKKLLHSLIRGQEQAGKGNSNELRYLNISYRQKLPSKRFPVL
jgi:hypothetical protein